MRSGPKDQATEAGDSTSCRALRLTLVGVGAMRSPRYAPAGLLLEWPQGRVLLDGGSGAEPEDEVDAWLVTDSRSELIAQIRRLARRRRVEPGVGTFKAGAVRIEPRQVTHTSHETYGYLIRVAQTVIVWAPEYWEFPAWAASADLMFADAAGWRQPIRFARGVGGHASALASSSEAKRLGVRRLVFAHLGRPTVRAIDAGESPPFGEFGFDGMTFSYRLDASEMKPDEPPDSRHMGRSASSTRRHSR